MPIFLRRFVLVLFACSATLGAFPQKTGTPSAETQQRINDVTSGLLPGVVIKGDPHPGHSLSERLRRCTSMA
jgi:hypothetical protein